MTPVKGESFRCDCCKADLKGWGGFIEYYDPSAIRRHSYRLCPRCQTIIAQAINEIMEKGGKGE